MITEYVRTEIIPEERKKPASEQKGFRKIRTEFGGNFI